MTAQIIRIDSIPRSELPKSADEVGFKGFTKALCALESLKLCSMRETQTAIENWVAAGMLSEREADELFAWHGWRRG